MEAKVTTIIKELEDAEILHSSVCATKEHKGGTDTILLEITEGNIHIAVKIEKPELVKQVVTFLETYKNIDLFPQLLYVSKNTAFFVYPFIKGEKLRRALSEQEVVLIIERVINHYVVSQTEYWGEQLYSSPTILGYINSLLVDQKEKIAEALGQDEHQKITAVAKTLFSTFSNKPFLTHGDLGAHNIILEKDSISGIIDPLIENSLPIIELAFLICSLRHDYGKEVLLSFYHKLKDNSGFSEDDFLKIYRIMLYVRIGRCIKYNPQDLSVYVDIYKRLF